MHQRSKLRPLSEPHHELGNMWIIEFAVVIGINVSIKQAAKYKS